MTSVQSQPNIVSQSWQQVEHGLPEQLCNSLVRLARDADWYEVCGFVMADGSYVEVENIDEDPAKGFTMDKDQMMDVIKGKTPIAATFHSHPSGQRWPSATDTEHMSFLYQQGCPWRYLIVTRDGVFEFEHRDRK